MPTPADHVAPPVAGTISVPDRSDWRRLWLPPVALGLLALVGLNWLDLPLARWSQATRPAGVLQELYDVAEAFGNGIGILLVAWAIIEFDRRRGVFVRVLALSFGSGLLANVVKLLIARQRPRDFDLSLDNAWYSFGPWLPLFEGTSGSQSFFSAHTATAVGLAVALTSLYPQAWRLCLALVALVGVSRVGGTAHFFSDVCIGAAVGWLFSQAYLRVRPMRWSLDVTEAAVERLFDRRAAQESGVENERRRAA